MEMSGSLAKLLLMKNNHLIHILLKMKLIQFRMHQMKQDLVLFTGNAFFEEELNVIFVSYNIEG